MRAIALAHLSVYLTACGGAGCRTPAGAARHAAGRRGEGGQQRPRRCRCCRRRRTSTPPKPDGTTALHWAVRNDDATLVDRLLRAGAKAKAREPLRRHADRPRLRERQRRGRRAAAQGRRQRERDRSARRDGAAHLRPHRQARGRAKVLLAHGAVRRRGRELARPDAADVGGGARATPTMVTVLIEAGADVNARSAIIAWERQRTRGAARQVAAARRAHAAAVRRARGPVEAREGARRRRRRHQHRRSRSPHARSSSRSSTATSTSPALLIEQRRRRQHGRQGRPDGALGRRGRPHGAGVEPAGAARDRRRR